MNSDFAQQKELVSIRFEWQVNIGNGLLWFMNIVHLAASADFNWLSDKVWGFSCQWSSRNITIVASFVNYFLQMLIPINPLRVLVSIDFFIVNGPIYTLGVLVSIDFVQQVFIVNGTVWTSYALSVGFNRLWVPSFYC